MPTDSRRSPNRSPRARDASNGREAAGDGARDGGPDLDGQRLRFVVAMVDAIGQIEAKAKQPRLAKNRATLKLTINLRIDME